MGFIHKNTDTCIPHSADKKSKRSKMLRNMRRNAELSLLCLPALTAYILFNYVPMAGLVMAFKKYTHSEGIFGSQWIGLKNFEFLVISKDIPRIVRNTVSYSLGWLILGMIVQVAVALLLAEINNKKSIKLFQTCMTLPNFLSWVVVGFITYAIFHPGLGILNQVLSALGGETVDVYSNAKYWPFILTFVNLWKGLGMGVLMYYASLMGIDPSLYEAAIMDGANRWQRARYISIPHLVSLMCILGILGMGNVLGGEFGLFYQIPRDVATLYETTDVLSTYLFRGLQNSSYGISSAIGLMQSVITLVLTVAVNYIVKKISPENSMF